MKEIYHTFIEEDEYILNTRKLFSSILNNKVGFFSGNTSTEVLSLCVIKELLNALKVSSDKPLFVSEKFDKKITIGGINHLINENVKNIIIIKETMTEKEWDVVLDFKNAKVNFFIFTNSIFDKKLNNNIIMFQHKSVSVLEHSFIVVRSIAIISKIKSSSLNTLFDRINDLLFMGYKLGIIHRDELILDQTFKYDPGKLIDKLYTDKYTFVQEDFYWNVFIGLGEISDKDNSLLSYYLLSARTEKNVLKYRNIIENIAVEIFNKKFNLKRD